MSDFHYYFAYGSNMNPGRVHTRKMPFVEHHGGVLHDYRLVFNKRSQKYEGAASANVVWAPGSRVEGVLYRLTDEESIQVMDPYEGYPVRYTRQRLPVIFEGRELGAWVYLANETYLAEGLMPARWYLRHLLAGEPHLTPEYYAALASVSCLPDSDHEPE